MSSLIGILFSDTYNLSREHISFLRRSFPHVRLIPVSFLPHPKNPTSNLGVGT